MKTIFSVCSGLGSIFHLTVNQRLETATLLPSGLVYLLLCFFCKVSIHHFTSTILHFSTFEGKELMSFEIFASFLHTIYSY